MWLSLPYSRMVLFPCLVVYTLVFGVKIPLEKTKGYGMFRGSTTCAERMVVYKRGSAHIGARTGMAVTIPLSVL